MLVNFKSAEYITGSNLVEFAKVLKSNFGVFNVYNKFHDSVICLCLINGRVVEKFESFSFDNLVIYPLVNEVRIDDLKHNSNLSIFGNFDKCSFNRNKFFGCPRGPVHHVEGELFDYYDYFKLKTPRIGWSHYNVDKLFNTKYTSNYRLKHDVYTAIVTCLFHDKQATLDEVLKFAKNNNITDDEIDSVVNDAYEFVRK